MALRSTCVRNLLVLSLLSVASVGISSIVSAGAGSGGKPSDEKRSSAIIPGSKRRNVKGGVKRPPQKHSTADTAVTDAIKSYRAWRVVNSRAHWVPAPMAAMCRAPLPSDDTGRGRPANPHQDKWVRVYVNPAGESAMMTQKVPQFPVGSVIVKEKLATNKSDDPELLTVMAKREAGYDKANGDWEYLALDGDARKVRARGKLANCQACHIPQKANGFVFRDYLPEQFRNNLK